MLPLNHTCVRLVNNYWLSKAKTYRSQRITILDRCLLDRDLSWKKYCLISWWLLNTDESLPEFEIFYLLSFHLWKIYLWYLLLFGTVTGLNNCWFVRNDFYVWKWTMNRDCRLNDFVMKQNAKPNIGPSQ